MDAKWMAASACGPASSVEVVRLSRFAAMHWQCARIKGKGVQNRYKVYKNRAYSFVSSYLRIAEAFAWASREVTVLNQRRNH